LVIVPVKGKTFKSNFASEPAPPSKVSVGVVVYPSPPPVTVIPVIVPDFLLNVGVSCASVVGLPPAILIVGKIEYPLPGLVTVTASIAYPRSCNGLSKWTTDHNLFRKGAPIHVRGGILYNYLVKENKLGNKYPNIQEGDKIKFLHLRQPNIYQSSAFSFITELPRELDIMDLIDYDEQFDKSFMEPLKIITDKMGWLLDSSYGTQGSLEDFFV